METLKPCQCGGVAHLVVERYSMKPFYGVRCNKCQKLLSMTDDRDKAIKEWNRRAEDGE